MGIKEKPRNHIWKRCLNGGKEGGKKERRERVIE